MISDGMTRTRDKYVKMLRNRSPPINILGQDNNLERQKIHSNIREIGVGITKIELFWTLN